MEEWEAKAQHLRLQRDNLARELDVAARENVTAAMKMLRPMSVPAIAPKKAHSPVKAGKPQLSRVTHIKKVVEDWEYKQLLGKTQKSVFLQAKADAEGAIRDLREDKAGLESSLENAKRTIARGCARAEEDAQRIDSLEEEREKLSILVDQGNVKATSLQHEIDTLKRRLEDEIEENKEAKESKARITRCMSQVAPLDRTKRRCMSAGKRAKPRPPPRGSKSMADISVVEKPDYSERKRSDLLEELKEIGQTKARIEDIGAICDALEASEREALEDMKRRETLLVEEKDEMEKVAAANLAQADEHIAELWNARKQDQRYVVSKSEESQEHITQLEEKLRAMTEDRDKWTSDHHALHDKCGMLQSDLGITAGRLYDHLARRKEIEALMKGYNMAKDVVDGIRNFIEGPIAGFVDKHSRAMSHKGELGLLKTKITQLDVQRNQTRSSLESLQGKLKAALEGKRDDERGNAKSSTDTGTRADVPDEDKDRSYASANAAETSADSAVECGNERNGAVTAESALEVREEPERGVGERAGVGGADTVIPEDGMRDASVGEAASQGEVARCDDDGPENEVPQREASPPRAEPEETPAGGEGETRAQVDSVAEGEAHEATGEREAPHGSGMGEAPTNIEEPRDSGEEPSTDQGAATGGEETCAVETGATIGGGEVCGEIPTESSSAVLDGERPEASPAHEGANMQHDAPVTDGLPCAQSPEEVETKYDAPNSETPEVADGQAPAATAEAQSAEAAEGAKAQAPLAEEVTQNAGATEGAHVQASVAEEVTQSAEAAEEAVVPTNSATEEAPSAVTSEGIANPEAGND